MDGQPETIIHRHSGWLIPLGFLLAILVLCGLFLAWYLRPGPGSGALTVDAAPVMLSVAGVRLAVPANDIALPAARAGGSRTLLALTVLYPGMRGYSQKDARLFADTAPDSPVIHLLLRDEPGSLDAAARLARIYRPYVVDPKGDAGPFGLTHYGFSPGSGYGGNDLFVGHGDAGLVLLLCERGEPALPAPNCLAAADPPTQNLSLSYRFKRAWLPQWRPIAAGVARLVAGFRQR